MIFMAVCDDQTADPAFIVAEIGYIRKYDVDPVHIFIRKSKTAVNNDHIASELKYCHVLPDLAQPAERNDFQFRCHGSSSHL